MTFPDDHIDPSEPRLARRVTTFSEQAVRPFDPLAIAAAAHAGARRRTLAGRLLGSSGPMARVGVVLAGALVAIAALSVFFGAGGGNLFGPGPSIAGPLQTPTTAPGAAEACAARDLSGMVTAWEGAAGHRIATITIRNEGSNECRLPEYLRPALIDANDRAVIVADQPKGPVSVAFPAGATAGAMVDMDNYCGPEPRTPLHIRLYLPSEESFELGPENGAISGPPAGSVVPMDVPPCNGPNAPTRMKMSPFELTSGDS